LLLSAQSLSLPPPHSFPTRRSSDLKTFKELIDMISMFISKHFKKLFLIIICLAGPLLILQYIFLFLSKKPFIANMMGSDDMRLKILMKLSYPVMDVRFEFFV